MAIATEIVRSFLENIPFNHLLGLKLVEEYDDGLAISCTVRDDLRNFAGVLHGGVWATLVDVAVGASVMRYVEGRRPATTVEMKLNYFRPVVNGTVIARAHLQRTGNHLCIGRVDLFDEANNLVGAGMATYMLLEGLGPASRLNIDHNAAADLPG